MLAEESMAEVPPVEGMILKAHRSSEEECYETVVDVERVQNMGTHQKDEIVALVADLARRNEKVAT